MMSVCKVCAFFMILLVLCTVLSTNTMTPPPPNKTPMVSSSYMGFLPTIKPGLIDDDNESIIDADENAYLIMNQFINQA